MNRPGFLLIAGLSLGVLGDLLFRAPLGLNFFVWIAAFLLVASRATGISPLHSGLALPCLFFAGCVVWRESAFLTACNTIVVVGIIILPHLQHAGIVLKNAFVADYARGLAGVLRHVLTGSARFLAHELPTASMGSPWQRGIVSTAAGIGLAVPVVVVFGTLYSSADPTFKQLFGTFTDVDPAAIVNHTALSFGMSLVAIGYLRGLVSPATPMTRPAAGPGRLGLTEIAIPLSGLIFLSLVFVVLQLPYLFGSSDMVKTAADLSFATYARRGFFELTTAVALVVPILLTADWALRHTPRSTKIFRALALVQIALVAVLVVSALHRMSLYWHEYGLTTTRVYASSFMLWIGSVLVWFALTVLRGRRRRFAFGALVSGLVALAALNFANPDNVIARVNIARGTRANSFDAQYLKSLSADAYPAVLENLSKIPLSERCHVLTAVTDALNTAHRDWRGFTISTRRAMRALDSHPTRTLVTCGDI